MRFDVVTLFPDFFAGPLKTGRVGRALEQGIPVGFVNPRDFTRDVHRTVDDAPFGGGGGMVMKVEPLAAALTEARSRVPRGTRSTVILLSPQGRPLRQPDLLRWRATPHLVLVAGRYEGFDERVRSLVDEEVSLADCVLTGGEIAALAIIDGVVRLLPGTLGNRDSPQMDSFSPGLDGLLEHPHYTRPAEWGGQTVPQVLVSGDHGRIEAWRRAQSLARTRARRPELLARVPLEPADQLVLQQTPRALPPVWWWVDPEGLEARDLELLGRTAAAYGVERVYLWAHERVADGAEWRRRVEALPHVETPPVVRGRRRERPARLILAERFDVRSGPDSVRAELPDGVRWVGSARPEDPRRIICPSELRDGAGWVLALGPRLPPVEGTLPALRRVSPHGRLPRPVAAAVQMDRWAREG